MNSWDMNSCFPLSIFHPSGPRVNEQCRLQSFSVHTGNRYGQSSVLNCQEFHCDDMIDSSRLTSLTWSFILCKDELTRISRLWHKKPCSLENLALDFHQINGYIPSIGDLLPEEPENFLALESLRALKLGKCNLDNTNSLPIIWFFNFEKLQSLTLYNCYALEVLFELLIDTKSLQLKNVELIIDCSAPTGTDIKDGSPQLSRWLKSFQGLQSLYVWNSKCQEWAEDFLEPDWDGIRNHEHTLTHFGWCQSMNHPHFEGIWEYRDLSKENWRTDFHLLCSSNIESLALTESCNALVSLMFSFNNFHNHN